MTRTSSSDPNASHPRTFDHRMAVFAADDAFVATALSFLAEGLAAPGETPPVAVTGPRRLDLLRDALGADARRVRLIPHADWYTGSAANAVAQLAGYLDSRAGPGGRVHLLMEPDWSGRAGRSARETAAWIRYEALVNVLFAPTAATTLCAYDTRTAGAAIVGAARRAHPDTDVYEDPLVLAAELDAVAQGPPASGAELLPRLCPVAVRARAAARGLAPADAELFTEAVAAALASLGPVTGALLWGRAPAVVCELRAERRVDDPLAGFVPPPGGELEPAQGLWFTRQVCAYVEVCDDTKGATVRLQYG